MKIASIDVWQLRVPLTTIYKLAFGEVRHFDSIIVRITTEDGREGLGEATLLKGYTEEAVEGSWALAQRLVENIASADVSEAKNEILSIKKTAPFTVTAFVTALEMIEGHDLLGSTETCRVPILGLLDGKSGNEIAQNLSQQLSEGYTTLKVKVGFDAQTDLARVQTIQRVLGGRAKIRLDANQGYTAEDGIWFASRLDPEGIELFEQPCPAGDWDGATKVARQSNVPMMLDESIFSLDDISRAADLSAAAFIKLKLMKVGGLSALLDGIAFIRQNGMEAVLGNGVAGDIGCWMESCVAAQAITTSGEMNGFLKPVRSILSNPLRAASGHVVIEPGYVPRLNGSAIEDFKVQAISATA